MRLRAIAFSAVLAATLIAAPAGRASTDTTVTRLRLTLQTTSDWATATFYGGRLLDAVVGAAPDGSQVVHSGRAFGVRTPAPAAGAPPAAATLDLIVDLGPNADTAVGLRKGDIGWAEVTVQRMNGTDHDVVAVIRNDRADGNNVQPRVDRDALAGAGLPLPKVDDRRLVLAFYYPWFKSESFGAGAWTDRPVTPWATDERPAVADMVSRARDAGVDGFVASWNGTATVADRFDLLLDVAGGDGFQVAPYLELLEHQDPAALAASLDRALARASHPAFLRADGRPVVFVYGTWTLDAARWREIRDRLAAAGTQPFFVGDSTDARFEFEGYHLYNPNRYGAGELRALDREMMLALRIPSQLHPEVPQRLWAATVSPGQNNLARNPIEGRYRDRENGLRYDRTWSAALASDPEWVLITSWNEWYEATHIAPGQGTGWRALDQTRRWSARFHASPVATTSAE